MKDFQIKIKILERVYPLKIDPKEEKALRIAVNELEKRIRAIKKETRAIDAQDLLAMVAFDLMVESQKQHAETSSALKHLEQLTVSIEKSI